MADYIAWTDVENVYPEAGDVEDDASSQAAIITSASKIADAFLAKRGHTPIATDSDGNYDAILVDAVACLAADKLAIRRVRGPEDITADDYDGTKFTGTYLGHRGMGLLVALADGQAALEADITPAEARLPLITASLSTTNGLFQARYSGGRFHGETGRSYVVTISGAGGTVAGGDLLIDITRDNDEQIWFAQVMDSTNWQAVEDGLEIRFVDAASAPVWGEDEYWTIDCTPPEATTVASGGPRNIEVSLG